MELTRATRLAIISILISMCSANLAVILLVDSPASGFEESIFTATPPLVWFLVACCFTAGIAVITGEVITGRVETSGVWRVGILNVLLGFATLLSIWILRGYAFWSPADPLDHAALTSDLAATGEVSDNNFYPGLHIFSAIISLCAGIDVISLTKLLPLLTAMLFVLFMIAFLRKILTNKSALVISVLFSALPIYGWYLSFTPNHFSVLVFPFALWILFQKMSARENRWDLILILILITTPIMHPIVSIVLISLIGVFLAMRMFADMKGQTQRTRVYKGCLAGATLVLAVTWAVMWISQFYVMDRAIKGFVSAVTGSANSSYEVLEGKMGYVEGLGYSPILIFAVQYCGILLLISNGLAYYIFSLAKRPESQSEQNARLVSYAAIGIAAVMLVLLPLQIGASPLRLLVFIGILLTPAAGLAVSNNAQHAESNEKRKKVVFAVVAAMLIIISLLGIVTVYPSKVAYAANIQVTESELSGMKWFINNRLASAHSSGLTDLPIRFAGLSLTLEERADSERLRNLRWDPRVSAHLGYGNHTSMDEVFDDTTYLILTKKDLQYQTVFPHVEDFEILGDDLQRLTQDVSVNHIYSNGEYDIYYIS